MYQAHGWWFPDQDTHFAGMLAKNIKKGGGPVYQEPVRKASIDFCKNRGLAFDIGANVGLWSRDLCANFRQVIAFEPVADFRLCLEQNVITKNISISPIALGAKCTTIDMIITQENTGHSHVDPKSLGQGSISMLTLDQFAKGITSNIDYIKIDCEGYENNILLGGRETILKHRPIMVVEDKKHKDVGHNDYNQAIDTLRSWGAVVLMQVRNDLILGW